MKEKIEHLYTDEQLQWYISQYNEVLRFLKVTWKFDLDDEIVDIKRWLIFDRNKRIYRDYLDYIHRPIKEMLWKQWWINCIKFTLKNWKDFVIADVDRKTPKLPEWVHSIEYYVDELKSYSYHDSLLTYRDKVYEVLSKIKMAEYDHFNSKEYLSKKQKADMFSLLNN
jgi:hypothetical protein